MGGAVLGGLFDSTEIHYKAKDGGRHVCIYLFLHLILRLVKMLFLSVESRPKISLNKSEFLV